MTTSTKKTVRLFLTVLLATAPASGRLDVQICGTYRERGHEEIALHRALTRRIALQSRLVRRAAPSSVSRDMGDIAILEDTGGLVARRNEFDLDRKLVRFVPTGGSTERYRFEVVDGGYDAGQAAGEPVSDLGDDDARSIALPFPFPFFGKTYSTVFINSDGNLTFDASDTKTSDRSVGRATSGPPRILPLFRDLDPSAVIGGVRVFRDASRFVVSWVLVPEYQAGGFGLRQTFQVRLVSDGTIEFAYQGITTAEAVVGIAPGQVQGMTQVVSFSAASDLTFSAAVLERFTNIEELDTIFVAQRFYETHDDSYDFLAVYNNMNVGAAPGAVAFETPVRNTRLGIGDELVDVGKEYGSSRRLQAMLNLGHLRQYPRDPNGLVQARASSGDTPLTVLAHEMGHLWLAFASVRDSSQPGARPMLNPSNLAHWAFTFNSDASLMEGNRIQDNGFGARPRFQTTATVQGFAPLDQYLMGLIPPEFVPPTFLITEATASPSRLPQSGVSIEGNRRDIHIDEIVAAEGRRVPDSTVSQRRFRIAVILVTAAGVEPTMDEIAQLQGYLAQFPAFFNRATGDRASVDATLKRNLQLSLSPAAGVLLGRSATATISLERVAEAPLTIFLRTQTGAVAVPGSVTIPAGQTQVSFGVRGERIGVEELSAEASDDRYATAYARVQVNGSVSALHLEVVSGDRQPATAGRVLPQPVVLRVLDRNNLPHANVPVGVMVTEGGTISPAQATSDPEGLVHLVWTPGAGALHDLQATIDGNPESRILVTALGIPVVSNGGVVNAASYGTGLVPGGLASIFGINLASGGLASATLPLPTELAGTRVLVNGRAATLLYVSDRQINFVVPPVSGTDAEVVVTSGVNSRTEPIRVVVRAVDPGIFFQPGTNLGAILIAGTAQTTDQRAARPGDVIEIYCTGLGEVAASLNGIGETIVRPQVSIGGIDAEVLYSGLAPGFFGLYQVNARVPAGAGTGPRPLVMQAAGTSSNSVLVILEQ